MLGPRRPAWASRCRSGGIHAQPTLGRTETPALAKAIWFSLGHPSLWSFRVLSSAPPGGMRSPSWKYTYESLLCLGEFLGWGCCSRSPGHKRHPNISLKALRTLTQTSEPASPHKEKQAFGFQTARGYRFFLFLLSRAFLRLYRSSEN